MMRHVDLCSGIGGFALGFEWAGLSKPVLFCDIEPWSRQILKKHWPDVPIAEDVKVLANDPDELVPDCEILTAGYACQPFSIAGDRRGQEDDRHIWPEIFTIIKGKRPTWAVFENVYGHVSMGLDEVLFDLERENYSVKPFVIPAVACDAPHRRDRVWIIARNMADTDIINRGSVKKSKQSKGETRGQSTSNSCSNVADTSSQRLQGSQRLRENEEKVGEWRQSANGSAAQRSDDARRQAHFWKPEPSVGRVAHGIPRRVDRIKGLGNAIVPQIAQRIGETIKQVEELNE